jgi:hypothetical protein
MLATCKITTLLFNSCDRAEKRLTYILISVLASACLRGEKLPLEKYCEFDYSAKYSCSNDTLKIGVKNPLNCPLRVSISSPDKSLSEIVTRLVLLL